MRVAGLLEPYLAMAPSLHVRGLAIRCPDAAAITYVGLRLPPCMPSVRLVLLGASLEGMAARGVQDIASWVPQTAPARRRRQFFDGHDRLAVLVSSPSDLDDIIPALVAYELEWNKLHELLESRPRVTRTWSMPPPSNGPRPVTRRGWPSVSACQRPSSIGSRSSGRARPGSCSPPSADERKKLAVRMLGGSWNDYERAVERWLEFVADNVPPDLTRRPIYFVSSNMHSLVESAVGLGARRARRTSSTTFVDSDSELLRAEYEGITSASVRSSLENFLYYAAKKYLADPRNVAAATQFSVEEQAAGISTLHVPLGPDVDAQVIELSKLRPERLDRRLADLPVAGAAGAERRADRQHRLSARAYGLLSGACAGA